MPSLRKTAVALSLLSVFSLIALPAVAERGDDADRVSKNGRLETTVGDVSVTVEYGRPQVKGREIWGGLVPHGAVWRTGANEATTFESSGDLLVEGELLPAGRYGLFTIPNEGEWTVIFNSVAEQWGAFDYDEGQDALRVSVSPQASDAVEEMEFAASEDGIALRWAGLSIPLALATP